MFARLTHFRVALGTIITLFSLTMAGCQGPITRDKSTAESATVPLAQSRNNWTAPLNTTPWLVDETASRIRLQVYRDGPLAGLGHNHVIEGPVSGTVFMATEALESAIRLKIPADKFVVDNPELRREAGVDFPPIPDAARRATRKNMLSGAVLNQSRFTDIEVYSVDLDGRPPKLLAGLKVWVAGREATLSVPFTIMKLEDRFEANASFGLNHADLGLTPFSVFGGALRVAETIDVTIQLVAHRP